MEDNKELIEYARRYNELLGFARTQFMRSNEQLHALYEQSVRAESCKPPESKECTECSECARLHVQICHLSNLLHNAEKEAQEMYLEMKNQLESQFELNRKLLDAMQNTQALSDNEKILKEKIEAKEAELRKLEAVNNPTIHLNSLAMAKKTIARDLQKKATLAPGRELPPKPVRLEKH